MIKGILFDLNGVLANTEKVNMLVWKNVYSYFKQNYTEEDYFSFIDGKKTADVLKTITDINTETAIEIRDKFWYNEIEKRGIEPFKDSIKFLKILNLNEIKTCIVTASRKAEFICKKANLTEYIDLIVGGNEISVGKPDPEIINYSLSKLKISPSEAILFDDSMSGIEAGLNANVTSYFVNRLNRNIKYKNTIQNFDNINYNDILN